MNSPALIPRSTGGQLMHTKPMSETEGTFDKNKLPTDCACRKCDVRGKVTYRIWNSTCGGYEDYKYTCGACGYDWWIDGIDS